MRTSNGEHARLATTAVALGMVVAGCSRHYYVRADHLDRGQRVAQATGSEVVVPALDRGRDPTYLRVDSIRRVEGVDYATGLVEVVARDPRTGLRIPGWITAGFGALFLAMGASASRDDDELAFVFFLDGGVLLGHALPLLILGYSLSGSEADGPSPGMPTTLSEPPMP